MIELNYFLSNEAINDIKEISIWYESKSENLGTKFQVKIFEAINFICKFPEAKTRYQKYNIRRFLMPDFPYKIFYDSTKQPLLIIAVIHASRSSQFIKKRIK